MGGMWETWGPNQRNLNIIQTWPAAANKLIMKKVGMVPGCVSRARTICIQ